MVSRSQAHIWAQTWAPSGDPTQTAHSSSLLLQTRVIRTLKAVAADQCKACQGSSGETQRWRLDFKLQWTLTNGAQGRMAAAERRRGSAKDSNDGPNG
ncbi:hypothetical protein V6N11_057787 [Hibiscus sabdariffa]|uniref:Uncharacterized protein n=2 Tax=Hibiscus sabdariffa TaxID=183260 RepID=A0ABR1ZF02_9ROSI